MFVQHIDLVYLVLPLALTSFVFQVIARPFPSPGRVVKVKAFSCERDEMEELILKRPLDSAQLEHVDFDTLFLKLDVDQVLSVFGTMLLERHIIFSANKLRYCQGILYSNKLCIVISNQAGRQADRQRQTNSQFSAESYQ
jgi:hypothetical protein